MNVKNRKKSLYKTVLPAILLAGAGAIVVVLPSRPLYAQEAVLLNTESGSIGLSDYSQGTGYLNKSQTTNTSIPLTTLNNGCSNTAKMAVGPFMISDEHNYNGGICRGTSDDSYSMYMYAAVIPGKNLRVKIKGDLSLTWSNFVTAGDQAYTRFSFINTAGGSSAAIGYDSTGASGSLSGIKTLELAGICFCGGGAG